MKLQIGCCGTTETYTAISKMGYDYVELSARQIMTLTAREFEQFLDMYRQTAFSCRGFNDLCSGDYPLVGPASNIDRLCTYMQELCCRGAALGIKTIGIGAPSARMIPSSYKIEQADEEMLHFLRMANPIAREHGIMLLVEAVQHQLCNYLNYTEEAHAIVKAFDDENVRLLLDYYHALVMGEDMGHFAEVMPYVRHLHISTDLADHQRGFMRECDIPEMRAYLAEAVACGYSGGISVEALPVWLHRDGQGCASYMREAIRDLP